MKIQLKNASWPVGINVFALLVLIALLKYGQTSKKTPNQQ